MNFERDDRDEGARQEVEHALAADGAQAGDERGQRRPEQRLALDACEQLIHILERDRENRARGHVAEQGRPVGRRRRSSGSASLDLQRSLVRRDARCDPARRACDAYKRLQLRRELLHARARRIHGCESGVADLRHGALEVRAVRKRAPRVGVAHRLERLRRIRDDRPAADLLDGVVLASLVELLRERAQLGLVRRLDERNRLGLPLSMPSTARFTRSPSAGWMSFL
jgi:hypothetical protein